MRGLQRLRAEFETLFQLSGIRYEEMLFFLVCQLPYFNLNYTHQFSTSCRGRKTSLKILTTVDSETSGNKRTESRTSGLKEFDLKRSSNPGVLLISASAVKALVTLFTIVISPNSDIITDIKIAGLRWAGHVQRMKNDEIVKRIMEGKPEGRRGVGRPCSRWRDAVQEDVKKLKIQNWWTVARDREVWRRILREAVTRPGL